MTRKSIKHYLQNEHVLKMIHGCIKQTMLLVFAISSYVSELLIKLSQMIKSRILLAIPVFWKALGTLKEPHWLML